jgi:hypothetical protein
LIVTDACKILCFLLYVVSRGVVGLGGIHTETRMSLMTLLGTRNSR